MAKRNPNIPSERVREMEGRTVVKQNDANERFAQKEAKLRPTAGREAQAGQAEQAEEAEAVEAEGSATDGGTRRTA